MTREISELMDGELDAAEADAILSRRKGKPEDERDWALYHLISDTIRQQAFYSPHLMSLVSARLAAEPTVLAPRPRAWRERIVRYAVSAAASLAAVAVVAWIGLQGAAEAPAPQLAAVQEPVAQARPASVPMPNRVNDYLLAHQEYSPSSVVHGVVPYVRTVSMTPEAGGR
jgi:sigma-E factor negative regulatory protein RseA